MSSWQQVSSTAGEKNRVSGWQQVPSPAQREKDRMRVLASCSQDRRSTRKRPLARRQVAAPMKGPTSAATMPRISTIPR
jgi:hypothetical protein